MRKILPAREVRSETKRSYPKTVLLALWTGWLVGTGCSEVPGDAGSGASHSAPTVAQTASVSAQLAPGLVKVMGCQPDVSIGSKYFLQTPHEDGDADALFVSGVHWGRLVQVMDGEGDPQMRDFLIAHSIRDGDAFSPSIGGVMHYGLKRNPVTGDFAVTIPAKGGTVRFLEALLNLEAGLDEVVDRGIGANELGPFTMVPRNATIAFDFQDLLAPRYKHGAWSDLSSGTVVNGSTGQLATQVVRVESGIPIEMPFATRVFCDPNHGDLFQEAGEAAPTFFPTRVLITPVVTNVDAQNSSPPLGVNTLGFPEGHFVDLANLGFRIPTGYGAGQTAVLRNRLGKFVSSVNNGSTDNSHGTLDVVRGMRSGGSQTQDAYNGYLFDDVSPQVIGSLGVQIVGVPVADGTLAGRFTLPAMQFVASACATSVEAGDVLAQGQVLGVVRGVDQGSLTNIVVDVLAPLGGIFVAGPARLQTVFEAGVDEPACFVRFFPDNGPEPARNVDPGSIVSLQFSEPMNVKSLTAYDGFSIQNGQASADGHGFDYAIGTVIPGPDRQTFYWNHHDLPLSHRAGVAEHYRVMLDGMDAPTDLAGNGMASVDLLPTVDFRLDPNAPELVTSGFALRFEDVGNELFEDGKLEFRQEQIYFDFDEERIVPRDVVHFTAAMDNQAPLTQYMWPYFGGIQEPLTPLGSKLQTLWRYPDLGFGLEDEFGYNVDVEGIAWAPTGGTVAADVYQEFSISLAHAAWLPDEMLSVPSYFPRFPASGLESEFELNQNDPLEDPLKVVHPKSRGFVINPGDIYQSSTGMSLLPLPLNQGLAPEDHQLYTWRDTALQALGGNFGGGVPLDSELDAYGRPPGTPKLYAAGEVPSVGLPLLMEFRCYPFSGALGLNSFDVSRYPGHTLSPVATAHSTGGVGVDGITRVVNPDYTTHAVGGFSTSSSPPGAQTNFGTKDVRMGELALVTRVSRAHSMWFDTGEGTTLYVEPRLEPAAQDLPVGTSVTLAFRGASAAPPAELIAGNPISDVRDLNPYGDSRAGDDVEFLNGDDWKSQLGQLDGARWFQFRLTFISDVPSGETAELRTLAFGYSKH